MILFLWCCCCIQFTEGFITRQIPWLLLSVVHCPQPLAAISFLYYAIMWHSSTSRISIGKKFICCGFFLLGAMTLILTRTASINSWSLSVCVSACDILQCMTAHMYVDVHPCGDQRAALDMFLGHCSPFPFKSGSLNGLELLK